MSSPTSEDSLLAKLDKVAPAGLNQFDAFPKLPATYKARSGGRGVLTLLVGLVSLLLVLNDVAEYFWGWPTYGFGIDHRGGDFMDVNVDVVVNMPCKFLSVDLRDAVGDRLYLSDGFRRDGTLFDIGQAQTLQQHTQSLDAQKAVAQSRKSRGFFDVILRRSRDTFRPTYNYKPDGGACRVYGSMTTKKVTANLHITTAGHGYRSMMHVDHKLMNLSHVITDFSFGPHFPEMSQPLKNTFELTHEPFIAYQYFLSVVPTTYISSGGKRVQTNQYSVTHYTRTLSHENGTPGIFFKFDLEPLNMTVHQRTTSFIQLLIRIVGVVGGVWCCAGWAFRISSKAIDVVSGADKAPVIVAEASGIQKQRWGGTDALRSRAGARGSANAWDAGVSGSPYGSYAGTPMSGVFPGAQSPYGAAASPALASPYAHTTPALGNGAGNGYGHGLGLNAGQTNSTFAVQQQQFFGPYSGSQPVSPSPYSPTLPNGSNHSSPAVGPQALHSPAAPPRRVSGGKDDKKVD